MISAIGKFIFYRVIGWNIKGQFPNDLKKYIIIIAPHTSNWDFLLGVIVRMFVIQVGNAKYLGKSQLFRPPYGWIFRALGGYPVDRSKHSNLVDAVVDIFNQHDEFCIALTPEGTRKKVDGFKSGFYYIAKGANIPILPVAFDYENRLIIANDLFWPGEDPKKDMETIMAYYSHIRGKNPENDLR